MRSVIFDTETTGMNRFGRDKSEGHRIIEIGCVEIIDRQFTGREFHCFLNPEQPIDPESFAVHGISDEQVKMAPTFRQMADEFLNFLAGADELVAHNIEFDQMFINRELMLINAGFRLEERFKLVDSLKLARQLFGGSRNNLDALCKRYGIDTSSRSLHGALVDSRLLGQVYLKMTGGQNSLDLTVRQQRKGNVTVARDGWLAIEVPAADAERNREIINKIKQ